MIRLWKPGEYRSCTNQRLVRDVGLVACGQCTNCHRARVKDWIGRILLEVATADHAHFATWTLGGDRLFEREIAELAREGLKREEVQACLKRLRWFVDRDWRLAVKRDARAWRAAVRQCACGAEEKTLCMAESLPLVGERRLCKAAVCETHRREYCTAHELAVFPTVKPKLRLFYVGEEGDMKGRPHYHLILCWYGSKGPRDLPVGRFCFHGKYPSEVVGHLNLQVIDKEKPRWDFRPGSGMDWHKSERTFWPHGMVKYEDFEEGHAGYIAGYIVKSQGVNEVLRPGISRRPVLGGPQIGLMAQDYVDAHLSPQSGKYKPPKSVLRVRKPKVVTQRNELGIASEKVKPVFIAEYLLNKAAVKLLCREFIERWAKAHKEKPDVYPEKYPFSEMLNEYEYEEAERIFAKSREGKPSVNDEVYEEFTDSRFREKAARWRRQPISLDDVGLASSSASLSKRSLDNEADAKIVEAMEATLSKAALAIFRRADPEERKRLAKVTMNRYRRLKTGS